MAGDDTVFRLRGETSYSQARRVGNLLFIAGTVSWDDDFAVIGEGDMRKQIETVYKDIRRTLAHFGLDARALVKETVYTLDMDALVDVNDVRMQAFAGELPPASTWIAIDRLANPKLLLEVEAVAVLPTEGEVANGMPAAFNLRKAEADFGYSQAVKAGSLLFISGVVSWDKDGAPVNPGNFAAQLTNVYEELNETLVANGADFSRVVKETIFTRDMPALVSAAPLRIAYYGDMPPPASTWIKVERLVHSDLLLEVEMIVELP